MHSSLVLIFVTFNVLIVQLEAQEELETTTEDGLASTAHALTPDETCELCQLTLRTVYGHFGSRVLSRRKLGHQLKRECNRHYTYRRRCLLFTKEHAVLLFQEMNSGDFKPIKPCFIVKECKRLQSPITSEFVDTYVNNNGGHDDITDTTSEFPSSTSTETPITEEAPAGEAPVVDEPFAIP